MKLQLALNNTSDYRIVIPVNGDIRNRRAADELASYFEKITGVRLPIVTDDTAAQDAEICVGPVARDGMPDVSGLKNDGFVMKSADSRIWLVGHNSRSNLYAVYHFLEDVLGCGFYAKDVEVVPECRDLSIETLDIVSQSPFEYRELLWKCTEYPGYQDKRGLNGVNHNLSANEPGNEDLWRYCGFCHTFFSYVNPDEYFDEHPEYFSEVDGVRIRDRTQLCMTNPDVLAIVKKKLRQNIIDNPNCKIFSLTQMDWYNPCTCPECARIDAEEGSHAGSLLRFVNACADSIAEEFPDVIIDTFAYQYTRKAPRITKPAPNVCVRLCSIECCFTHPLSECRRAMFPFLYRTDPDSSFQQDLSDWAKICDRLYIWDYTTNYRFYLAPMANLHVIQPNVQYYAENSVKGLFEQGNHESVSGEFGELRAYLLARLLWDPYGDMESWMVNFLRAYYGKAAEPIHAYIKMLSEHVTKYDMHGGIFENPKLIFHNTLIPRMDALWDEAERLADNEEILARVQRSRIQVRFLKFHRMGLKEPNFTETCEALIADISRFGITRFQEGKPVEESFEQMRTGNLPGVRTF